MEKEVKRHDATHYRKRPVVVEAARWFKDGDHPEVKPHGYGEYDPLSSVKCGACGQEMFWKSSMGGGVGVMHFTHGEVKTLESKPGSAHLVCPGDWIIKGVKGEHYACKPDIFEATYEPASAVSETRAPQDDPAFNMQAAGAPVSATRQSALVEACRGLISYWTRNLNNFQWEKADTHVKRINIALEDK